MALITPPDPKPQLDLVAEWTGTPSDDKPKTWGEMTDAEKGALLLANLDGKVQYNDHNSSVPPSDKWHDKSNWFFGDCSFYRIKPAPVVGEVVVTGKGADHLHSNSHQDLWQLLNGYAVTFPTVDGVLATGTFTGPDGRVIASWCQCTARHGVSNLKQFPFKKTGCDKFKGKRQ